MGIYDRDYYRREGSSFLAGLADQGRTTYWLIGITVCCFIAQFVSREPLNPLNLTEWLQLDIRKVLEGQVWRLLGYAFLHDLTTPWHVLGNMLLLFFFGRQVEERVGSLEFLTFYLVAAVLAGVGTVLLALAQQEVNLIVIGASGAVLAVLVVAAFYNPSQTILLFFVIPIPVWVFIGLMLAQGLIPQLTLSDRVAWSTHLSGAVFGLAYFKLHWRLLDLTAGLRNWLRRPSRPRLRVYSEEEPITPPIHKSRPGTSDEPAPPIINQEVLEAQVDAILEKIARVGMEGLTDKERQVLLRASELARRRRN
jgi:membrane associated rhomboid family serine protease